MSNDPTIEAYNTYAVLYDQEVTDFWNNFPKSFVDKFKEQTQGKHLLNLGSGSGRDAVILRDEEFNVVCLDASKEMVELTGQMGVPVTKIGEEVVIGFDQPKIAELLNIQ